MCARTRERQGPRDRHQKRKIDKNRKKGEMQTNKQNVPGFKPPLGVFDDVFFIHLSVSPL